MPCIAIGRPIMLQEGCREGLGRRNDGFKGWKGGWRLG